MLPHSNHKLSGVDWSVKSRAASPNLANNLAMSDCTTVQLDKMFIRGWSVHNSPGDQGRAKALTKVARATPVLLAFAKPREHRGLCLFAERRRDALDERVLRIVHALA